MNGERVGKNFLRHMTYKILQSTINKFDYIIIWNIFVSKEAMKNMKR